ncbi:MAG: FkbM family methyltransferase [Rhodospirillaceae bacterium]|nr:FkbM family methyltransferase [Rhodospirillaceae bacterium]
MMNNLIFDLGFHFGEDTDFYLAKGFDVVAVEANPYLIDNGRKKYSTEIKNGKLTLLHNAISSAAGKESFYIHPNKTEWSSCLKEMAESDGSSAEKVSVDAVNILQLTEEYGVPYYMKVDVEGCDVIVASQLSSLNKKPLYVSFETSKKDYADIFSYLHASGYDEFQLVNQINNEFRPMPEASMEGNSIDYKFGTYSSGFFGKDLPGDRWLTYDEALTQYIKYKELKKIDNKELGLGWLDVHARRPHS